ncbi:MAG: metallophosphoesterase [Bacteroidales bacterium]
MKFFIVLSLAMTIWLFNPGKPGRNTADSGIQDQTPLFSFGIFTDVQYCDCEPAESRFYRNSFQKLKEAIESFKEAAPEFVINIGDLIEKDYVSFGPVMKLIEESGLKVYHAAGNHDFSIEQRHKRHILPLLSIKEGYYSFSHRQFRFIVLNGNEISIYGPGSRSQVKNAEELISRLKTEGEPNYHDWNGGIGPKQLLWLQAQLTESSQAGQKVFIICHFPVWPVNEHNLLNYKEVIEILGKYNNIIAWFNGHNHAGNYGNTNMIHFVTFKGIVETENTNSFALIEVYMNKIWIKGYGRERSMILAY